MSKFKIELDASDHSEFASYARQMNKTRSRVIRDWIYFFAYSRNIGGTIPSYIELTADTMRMVAKIGEDYNHRQIAADITGGDVKFSDVAERLIRRGIADMITKGDRDP